MAREEARNIVAAIQANNLRAVELQSEILDGIEARMPKIKSKMHPYTCPQCGVVWECRIFGWPEPQPDPDEAICEHCLNHYEPDDHLLTDDGEAVTA